MVEVVGGSLFFQWPTGVVSKRLAGVREGREGKEVGMAEWIERRGIGGKGRTTSIRMSRGPPFHFLTNSVASWSAHSDLSFR